MAINLKKSNDSHEKLMKKNVDLALSYGDRTPSRFVTMVNAQYHALVLDEQIKRKKVLNDVSKKEIYKKAYKDMIDTFKRINESSSPYEQWYIPKKNTYFVRRKNGTWSAKTKWD